MATYTPITPTEVTLSATGWADYDLTTILGGDGHAGVALHIVTNSATGYAVGWRMNGSSDNRTTQLLGNSHTWAYVGCDSGSIIELNVGSTTGVDVYVVGYFDAPAVFNTNGWAKSPTSTTFTDRSIATETGTDTAIVAFLDLVGPSYSTAIVRNDGSSDSRVPNSIDAYWHSGGMIGVTSEVFENRYDYSGATCHVVGYIKDTATDVTVHTNAVARATSTGTWPDMPESPALPSGTVAVAYEVFYGGYTQENYGLRKGGTSENIYQKAQFLAHALVATEATTLDVEYQVASADTDFYQLVTFQAAGGTNHPLAGTLAGTGTLSGAAVAGRKLAGPCAGTGSLSGVLVRGQRLIGAAAATATCTATLVRGAKLAGACAGIGVLNGVLIQGELLAGQLVGTSSGNAILSRGQALAGAWAGTGTLTATLGAGRPLAGTLAGAAAFTATFETSVPPPTSVVASALGGGDYLVDWDDVANADSYVVERRIDGGSWTQVVP